MVGQTAIVLIVGLLWRWGGYGKPFGKHPRRYGYPLVAGLYSFFVLHASPYNAILLALTAHLTTRLPLTLQDSDIDTAIEWAWVWIAGFLIGAPAVILHGWNGLLYALLPMCAQGISITLSNIKQTADFLPHDACEILIGCAVMGAMIG